MTITIIIIFVLIVDLESSVRYRDRPKFSRVAPAVAFLLCTAVRPSYAYGAETGWKYAKRGESTNG